MDGVVHTNAVYFDAATRPAIGRQAERIGVNVSLDAVGHAERGVAVHFHFDGEVAAFADADGIEIKGQYVAVLAGEGDAGVEEI